MKKPLLLLFCFFSFISIVKAQVREDTFHSTFHYKYHYVDHQGMFGDFEIIQRDADGAYAYCIEPGKPLTTNSYTGYQLSSYEEMASYVGISKQQLQDISLYAYFGYLYEDHTDSSWIVAVQSKIWQLLGRDFQFTSRNSQANPYLYVINTPFEIEQEMNELEQLKEAYYHPPTFSDVTLQLGEEKEIMDFALYDFELVSKSPNVEKKGPKIIIHGNELGDFDIHLQRRFLNHQDNYFVYHQDNGQDLFLTGNIDDVNITIHYSVKGNEILLEKLDEDSKECVKAFDEAVYSLYKNDGTFILDVKLTNCRAKINNLPLGKYYFLEKTCPEGYELDPEKHDFEIQSEQSLPIKITILEKKIKRNLQIHKDYTDYSLQLHAEENAVFEILNRDSLELVTSLKTDKQGNGKTILEYGNYVLRQVKGKENYAFIKDLHFSIQKEDVFLNLENKPYTKDVVVQKIDATTKEPIFLEHIAFELLDQTTQKKICPNKECLFYTDEYGKILLKDLPHSLYLLKEVPQKIKGYLVNPEPLSILVSDNSPLTYEFENKPRMISLQILKYKKEQNRYLKGEEGAEFKIWKGKEEIETLRTDENGIAKTTLPYGDYEIVQTKGSSDYTFIKNTSLTLNDESKDEVSLKFINTPILKNVIVIKKDALTKERIFNPNLKFELYDITHQEKVCQNKECLFQTNEKGELFLNNLIYATYELKEIPQFIKGYAYQKKPLTFTIDQDSIQPLTLDFYNDPVQGKIHILKIDENNRPMPNVEFQILDAHHKLIGKATTSEDGSIDIFVKLGTYYIQEVSTAVGYQLDKQIYEVTLTQENSEKELVRKNLEVVNYPVPNTLKNQDFTCSIFFLLGFYIYVKKKHFLS